MNKKNTERNRKRLAQNWGATVIQQGLSAGSTQRYRAGELINLHNHIDENGVCVEKKTFRINSTSATEFTVEPL